MSEIPKEPAADNQAEAATQVAGENGKSASAENNVTTSLQPIEAEELPKEAPAAQPIVSNELAVAAGNDQVRGRMRCQTRRGFLGLATGALGGLGAWEWLNSRREMDGTPWPFREALEVNEQLARDFFSARRLSPIFPARRISADRLNGDVGMDEDLDVAAWKLQVHGLASQDGPLALTLDAIKDLPRTEMTTELKCIEGWSAIVQWAGAKFTDFIKAYPPDTMSGNPFRLNNPDDLPGYVSMETPDGGYFVGLDMQSMLHPQTLLCYERNGQPLTQDHGAPLRLVIPVKYGVKNLKRIGAIRYTTLRPADYWGERGYDWYIGL